MKRAIIAMFIGLVSLNASALQLLCESPEKSASGKAMMVYLFNSSSGTMERFAYIPSKNAYAMFGELDNLVFSDDLYNMVPLRRNITAKSDDVTMLDATWVNGSPDFKAKIAHENSKIFNCKLKN